MFLATDQGWVVTGLQPRFRRRAAWLWCWCGYLGSRTFLWETLPNVQMAGKDVYLISIACFITQTSFIWNLYRHHTVWFLITINLNGLVNDISRFPWNVAPYCLRDYLYAGFWPHHQHGAFKFSQGTHQ